MSVIDDMFFKVERVKPLSESASRLIQIIGNPDHTIQEVTDIVECDAALTGMVLKIANSAAFGLQAPVNTVKKALAFLGDKMAAGIAMGMCANSIFNAEMEGYASNKGDLWTHCLRTALAARELAKYSDGEVSPEIAYTAGLMHDIGKAILTTALVGSVQDIIESLQDKENHDFREAERRKFGIDHCEVGGALSDHWRLPPLIKNAILFHHSPVSSEADYKALVYVIHVADMVAMMSGKGTGADSMRYELDNKYTNYLSIENKELENLIYHTDIEFEKTASAIIFPEESGK